jgi:hypothetical protein
MNTPGPSALARSVAALYQRAPAAQRLRLLNALLRPVGPLALVTVAAGAFGGLLPAGPEARWRPAVATIEDTWRVGPEQVGALADYVAQKAPELLVALATEDPASPPA